MDFPILAEEIYLRLLFGSRIACIGGQLRPLASRKFALGLDRKRAEGHPIQAEVSWPPAPLEVAMGEEAVEGAEDTAAMDT
jgi:hypothetical protein